MLRTLHKRYPNMGKYEVRNDFETYAEIDAKAHCLRIMRLLRNNDFAYLRLNATSQTQIRKVYLILELLSKWVFVEECFSDKGAVNKRELNDVRQGQEYWHHRNTIRDLTKDDQLSVIIRRSYDFGEKYLSAKRTALRSSEKEVKEAKRRLS